MPPDNTNYFELWNEIKHMREIMDEIRTNQKQILNELGGNGGPGIRTKIYNMERRVRVVEIAQIVMALVLIVMLFVFAFHLVGASPA